MGRDHDTSAAEGGGRRPLGLLAVAALLLSMGCGDGSSPMDGGSGLDGAPGDAGAPDAAGDLDARLPSIDAGADAGAGFDATVPPTDAGSVDAGSVDAGSADAGSADAGAVDAAVMCAPGTLDCTSAPGCESSATAPGSCGGCGIVCLWGACSDRGCDPVDMDSGDQMTCAIRASGAVHCWGASPDVSSITNAVALDVSTGRDACAVLATGEVVCWRDTSVGVTTLAGISDAVDVALHSSLTCVLRSGGVVSCADLPGPWIDVLTGARDITAGWSYVCAVLTDGTARCFGQNAYGSLGDGTTTTSFTPRTVLGVSNAVAIDSGTRHVCVRTTTGELYCWGDNTNGQVGDGTRSLMHPTPSRAGTLVDVVDVACGGDHTCATRATGEVVCWGNDRDGQLGDGTIGGSDVLRPGTPVSGISDARRVSAGTNHTCAILATGAWCWGENGSNELGDGTYVSTASPVAVSAP